MAIDTVNALSDLNTVKEYCKVKVEDVTYDDLLEQTIDGMSIEFNRRTRRNLIARDRTDYYDGPGGVNLFLHDYPINSVTTIHEDSEYAWGSATEISSDDYQIIKDRGIIFLVGSSSWGTSPKAIKIVYNAGYILATLPKDLLLAFLAECKRRYRIWLDNQENQTSIVREAVSVQLRDDELLPTTEATLKHYRRKGHTGGRTT